MPLSRIKTNSVTPAAITGVELGVGMTGQVGFFTFNAVPVGWLKANGAAVSRTAYASLFAVIGTTYGSGDSSTTFNLPDLRGEFLRCLDDGRSVDTGRNLGSTQTASFESHSHNITSAPHNGGQQFDQTRIAGNVGYPTNGIGTNAFVFTFNEGQRVIPTGGIVNSNTGGTETRPRNVALLACIKF
jgi:microcystin-dependent protein